MLLVVSGLPGTGKSTLAHAVGHELGAPVISKDIVEATLRRSGILPEQGSWWMANDLLIALADDLLRQGRTVVLDAVCGTPQFREQLRATASATGSALRIVECLCSDVAVHRLRIEGRRRGIEGWPELQWADVERTRDRYQPWIDDRLVVDALDPLEANVDMALRYVSPAAG